MKRRPPDGNVRRVASFAGNLRGVMTNKADRLVQYESWQEHSFLLRLDRDPTVIDYQSQPEVFHFRGSDGKHHQYTPDFRVVRSDGTIEIHEVTISGRRDSVRSQAREQAAHEICVARGWRYIVHTEETLPRGTEHANLLALYPFRPSVYANKQVAESVTNLLADGVVRRLQPTIREIATGLTVEMGQVVRPLFHMLWHGDITTDHNVLLIDAGAVTPTARVWL
jgi:hypothetical protein